MEQGPAVAAGGVALIIAVLAEGDILGPGIVLPPDPLPALPAEYRVFFQAAETQSVSVKGVQLGFGYLSSALRADVWLVGHDDRLLYNKVKAPGNYPEAFYCYNIYVGMREETEINYVRNRIYYG